MIRVSLAVAAFAFGAMAASAQGRLVPADPADNGGFVNTVPDVPAEEKRAVAATGAVLKGLDKMSGAVTDLSLRQGESGRVGRIEVTLGECRYPEDNPTGEGYAWLTIRDTNREDAVVFDGWMIASSPGLNALDHARYDVWVIRCTTA